MMFIFMCSVYVIYFLIRKHHIMYTYKVFLVSKGKSGKFMKMKLQTKLF